MNCISPTEAGSAEMSLETLEKVHIQKILARSGGNKPEAARMLGIGLTTR